MDIVIINGQNHKGTTYHMGKLLAEKLTTEDKIQEFFLPKDLNHFCLGCYACIDDETRCPYWREKEVIINAMQNADLLIFTTPNYCLSPSGAMKSFLDLMFDYWMVHKPKEWMFNKRAVILSASAGASCKNALNVIKTSLTYWGIPYIKIYGLPVHAMSWDMTNSKTKAKIERVLTSMAKGINTSKPPHIGIKTRALFFIMSKMHSCGWDSSPTEKQYWAERGWLNGKRPWKK